MTKKVLKTKCCDCGHYPAACSFLRHFNKKVSECKFWVDRKQISIEFYDLS